MDFLFGLLFWAFILFLLLRYLFDLLMRGVVWVDQNPGSLLARIAGFLGRTSLPGIPPLRRWWLRKVEERARLEEENRLRLERERAERERRAEEERRRREKLEAKRRAELERQKQERDALIGRPIPPDVRRDMRAFLEGHFFGEDRSPLAFVGYRVGKTRGLLPQERQKRLEVCFRIEIPREVAEKYRNWGDPVTSTRFHSIARHLRMLADMRGGQRNMKFAVADWEADLAWFQGEFNAWGQSPQRSRRGRYRRW